MLLYVRTDTFAGVDHHAPRCEHALYMDGQEGGGVSGLQRLLGTIGYEGACASGKISCIAVASQHRLTSASGSILFFLFLIFYYYLRLALVPCRESVRQGWHAGAVAVPVARYIASAPPP